MSKITENYYDLNPTKAVKSLDEINVPFQEAFNRKADENVTNQSKQALINNVFENKNKSRLKKTGVNKFAKGGETLSSKQEVYTPYEFLHELLPKVYASQGNPRYIVSDEEAEKLYKQIAELEGQLEKDINEALNEDGADTIYELEVDIYEKLNNQRNFIENLRVFISESELKAFVLTNPNLNPDDYVKDLNVGIPEMVDKELVMLDITPDGDMRWVYRYQYLCGNLNEKITNMNMLRAKYLEHLTEEQFDRQINSLRDVKNPTARISLGTVNSMYLSAYSDFAMDKNKVSVSNENFVNYDRLSGNYSLQVAFIAWLKDGTDLGHVLPTDLKSSTIENIVTIYAKGNKPVVPSTIESESDAERYIANTTENAIKDGSHLFNKFLNDALTSETKQRIEMLWNHEYNNLVLPKMYKIPVALTLSKTFKDGAEFIPNPTQIQAVQFQKNAKSGLLAYGVGVGKTAASILNVSYALDNNLSKYPLFVVPLPTYEKWMNEIKGGTVTSYEVTYEENGSSLKNVFTDLREAKKFSKDKNGTVSKPITKFLQGLLPHVPNMVGLGNLGADNLDKIKDYTEDDISQLKKLEQGRDFLKTLNKFYAFDDESINSKITDFFPFFNIIDFRNAFDIYVKRFEIGWEGKRKGAKATEKKKTALEFLMSDFKQKSKDVYLDWVGINKRIAQRRYELGTYKNFPEKTIFICTYQALGYLGVESLDEAPENALVAKDGLMGKIFNELTQGDELDEIMQYSKNKTSSIAEKLESILYGGTSQPKVYLKDLGIDYLVVDESHFFKKIFTRVKGAMQYPDDDYGYSSKTGLKDRRAPKYKTLGLATDSPSQRALSMYCVTRYIQFKELEASKDGSGIGGNVCHLTATPFTNNPIEVYSMLALTNYDLLKKAGYAYPERFFDVFMKIEFDLRLKANRIKKEQVLVGYNNAPQMRSVIFYLMDYKNGDDTNIKRPTKVILPSKELGVGTIMMPSMEQEDEFFKIKKYIKGDIDYNMLCEMDDDMDDDMDIEEMSDSQLLEVILAEGTASQVETWQDMDTPFSEDSRNKAMSIVSDIFSKEEKINEDVLDYDEKAVFRFLKGMSMMRQVTLSPYLMQCKKASGLEPTYSQYIETSPKLKYTVDCIKSIHDYEREKGLKLSGVVIYMNLGVHPDALAPVGEPLKNENGQTLVDSKGNLVYEYKKVKWKSGGFEKIKQYLVHKLGYKDSDVVMVNGGMSNPAKETAKNRFLGGQAKILIGSSTISTGVDLQNNASTLFMCAYDWNPTDNEQIAGRIHRQGNRFNSVRIVYPMVNDSVDPLIFQLLQEKTLRIKEIWDRDGKSSTLDLKDFDPQKLKSELITDPESRADFWYEDNIKKLADERLMMDVRLQALRKASSDYSTFLKYLEPARGLITVIDSFRKEAKRKQGLKAIEEKIKEVYMMDFQDEVDESGKVIVPSENKMAQAVTKIKKDAYDYQKDPEGRFTPEDFTTASDDMIFDYVTKWVAASDSFWAYSKYDRERLDEMNDYVNKNHQDWGRGIWITDAQIKELDNEIESLKSKYSNLNLEYQKTQTNLQELQSEKTRLNERLMHGSSGSLSSAERSEMEVRYTTLITAIKEVEKQKDIIQSQMNVVSQEREEKTSTLLHLTGGAELFFDYGGGGIISKISNVWRGAKRSMIQHLRVLKSMGIEADNLLHARQEVVDRLTSLDERIAKIDDDKIVMLKRFTKEASEKQSTAPKVHERVQEFKKINPLFLSADNSLMTFQEDKEVVVEEMEERNIKPQSPKPKAAKKVVDSNVKFEYYDEQIGAFKDLMELTDDASKLAYFQEQIEAFEDLKELV